MKDLHLPLKSGLIPLVEIARVIYPDLDIDEQDFFNNPEFHDNKLLISITGDKNGCGITDYLFFEDMQVKIKVFDRFWTSDNEIVRTEIISFNPFTIIKKLIEIGAMTCEDVKDIFGDYSEPKMNPYE